MKQSIIRSNNEVEPPYSLLAELTHRCPLHCPYCSNPIEMTSKESELSTEEWNRVLSEAADLGVVEVHFSGGEPLLRDDLEVLISRAHSLEMYSNLITSGIGLTMEKATQFKEAGLENVQVSFQAGEAKLSDKIGGYKAFEKKREAVQAVKEAQLHLSLNVVLHQMNLENLNDIILLAEEMGAERLELANTQYYNWALLNRKRLLPSREQVERAREVYEAAKVRLKRKMEIIWVIPDYYSSTPKPCMGGWGAIGLTVAPNGVVLPCPTAGMIKDLSFENIRHASLRDIWYDSMSFNSFRGDEWMPDPCRSCDLRHEDGGGCRCQAFALTGDAYATDPTCMWAPDHQLIEAAIQDAKSVSSTQSSPIIYRRHFQDKPAFKK
ncbi:pyrroloquinoline quinone biosynthesis protein PqqE [Heyndrickxia sporothermodurans]|uniref:pyrroloquinoline quinone biosynthesis protein PqqE n=1 Tax=Heyndrickxia sporothermodurans TaxID=46224 RepID=UPI002E1EE963|nr:pyrroloquinoline quinone biosynthesis protein PqqE [Heyndrickxia sporothermodurans]MED3652020.1 pyrroloquinoline quinone biosynthesis protein PqqE [Heyndrickxia sporothermodurans]MED3697593.1 pyrroloquinoline quinone biosynthesis protein PqqE [Heyndrickxia sporothermodurans]